MNANGFNKLVVRMNRNSDTNNKKEQQLRLINC